ncbi:1,4-alpha-glucan branching protein [Nocardia yamanashiensis]|uniref:maltokinase N-terminal cap-like domain-containing protein n=1 Tax=Nocardia yamanashiensis TaxID=209247 RepID=UPI001E6043CA|nr:1,4-alpha-glucan branching protein [Nocardia yamanashiensis]UGT43743.1 1,4-alpha-glucan branching protein [Nocardia yamanashiensis]
MAEVHRTTLVPTKIELLAQWLPKQEWYRGDDTPKLVRAGGFRIDDPAGEVGIECYVAVDENAGVAYHVPMTYRGAPLADAETALIGTTEHGVLGTRWVYDATGDPVFAAQAAELLAGRVRAQAQSESDAVDSSVHVSVDDSGAARVVRVLVETTEEPEDGGFVSAPWTNGQGETVRGVLLTAD